MPRPRWEAIHWLAPDRFRLDDVTFWLTTTDFQTPSTPDQFVASLVKPLHSKNVRSIVRESLLVLWSHVRQVKTLSKR